MKILFKTSLLVAMTTVLAVSVSCDEGNDGGGGTTPPVKTETYNWNSIAAKAQGVLEGQFWRGAPDNYYWVDNSGLDATFYHYWQTAHAMETLMDAYERTGDDFYKERVRTVLARIKQSTNGKYINEYYDDMAWMGMACLRAYGLFAEAEYLTAAQILFADVKGGWQGSDSGMLWDKKPADVAKRNACTHWTVACFAAEMFLQSQKTEDLTFAIGVYEWAMNNLYNASLGATFDGTDSTNTFLTYNQGVLIGSSLTLYNITRNSNYLNTAVKCADFSINNSRFGADGIWRDEGASGTLNKNNGIFKGILVHYMIDLIGSTEITSPKRMSYVRYLEQMAVTLNKAAGSTSLFPGDWRRAATPGETIYLGCQMSGTILMEALAVLGEEYPTLLRNNVE